MTIPRRLGVLGLRAGASLTLARLRPILGSSDAMLAAGFCTLGRKPTLEDALLMPRRYYELPNDVLVTMACQGDHLARSERLVREIMVVDQVLSPLHSTTSPRYNRSRMRSPPQVSWDDAQKRFKEMEAENHRFAGVLTLPYKSEPSSSQRVLARVVVTCTSSGKRTSPCACFTTALAAVGIVGGIGSAVACLPMIFDEDTARWFNELYVTTDVPEPADLETWLEVTSVSDKAAARLSQRTLCTA